MTIGELYFYTHIGTHFIVKSLNGEILWDSEEEYELPMDVYERKLHNFRVENNAIVAIAI